MLVSKGPTVLITPRSSYWRPTRHDSYWGIVVLHDAIYSVLGTRGNQGLVSRVFALRPFIRKHSLPDGSHLTEQSREDEVQIPKSTKLG
jgi:hypothetical protein